MSGARVSDPATSHAAAAIPRAGLRARVLAAHVHHDDRGLTDDELVQLFPEANEGSVKKRRSELSREGLVTATDRTRPTRRGCAAVVWKATVGGWLASRGVVFDGRRPDESERTYRDRVEFLCHDLGCRRSFTTETGLLRHQIRSHGFATVEAQRLSQGRSSGGEA